MELENFLRKIKFCEGSLEISKEFEILLKKLQIELYKHKISKNTWHTWNFLKKIQNLRKPDFFKNL